MKLLPDEGAANQSFGVSVAIDSQMAAVGSRTYFELESGFTISRVFLFNLSNGNQLDTLTAINGTWTDFFADTIDIDDGLIAVGAWARSIFFDHSGAAYVFDASNGSQLEYIFPSDGHDRDNFGISISIDNGMMVIGSHQDDDNGFNSGSAYLYDASNGQQLEKLIASDGDVLDLFGSSAAIDDGVIAVGASGNNSDMGAVYVFGGSPSSLVTSIWMAWSICLMSNLSSSCWQTAAFRLRQISTKMALLTFSTLVFLWIY